MARGGEIKKVKLAGNFNPKVVNWLAGVISQERQSHLNFFGREFDLSGFEAILHCWGRKGFKFWQSLGLEPHFLPTALMRETDNYPGWKIKPERWFFQQCKKGKIFRESGGELTPVTDTKLEGITALIDIRAKPDYANNGGQMYEFDNLLGPELECLRRAGRLADYENGQPSSRFGIFANKMERIVKPALAVNLHLMVKQLRLETTIERNVIPQLYPYMPRQRDGLTNTSVWCEEYFENYSQRLFGGNFDAGGLAHVDVNNADSCSRARSFRFLAML